MPNELLERFLIEHVAGDGKCSCGWAVDDYDLDRPWGGEMSATEAWTHHVRRASYEWFENHRTQYVEAAGPDGEQVAFTLRRDTLLHDHTGWSLDNQRQQREEYGYQYDGYERPPRDPDDCSVSMTCEEAECRNVMCSGGHFRLQMSVPSICGGCRREFADGEERVMMSMQAPEGRPIVDGDALATTAAYHPACQPSDEDLRQRAGELWPKAAPSDPEPQPELRQAMACLSCGLAGEVPEEHFPQEPGLWDRPCPQCGTHMVWVTEET